MNGISKPSSERVYLHRDENDEIFVESSLHQHHIDGIRFMYKQFKKKRPGVIINNPLGYGNSLQVALFLGAVRHVLSKPILILCERSEEMNWLEHFQKLSQCYNVGVGAESPFVKKSIFINTMDKLEQFCRRDWSVMVVDDNAFLKEKALQAKFKADFKIWITPYDMKDHLETFASIFKWIFPKEKLNMNDFKAAPGNRTDAVSKSILLEAFLEDIVCRTTLLTPFENPYDSTESTPRKSSKKNKDASGTKIKRSKRLLDTAQMSSNSDLDLDTPSVSAAKVPKTENNDNDFNISNFNDDEAKKKRDKNNTSDIETFIRDEEPIKYDAYNEYDSISRNSQDSKAESMDDEPIFDTTKRLNKVLESNGCLDIAADPEGCFMDSESSSDSLRHLPKVFDDTSQTNNSSDFERKQVTRNFLSENIPNGNKEEMSVSPNSLIKNKVPIVDSDDSDKLYMNEDSCKDECEDNKGNSKTLESDIIKEGPEVEGVDKMEEDLVEAKDKPDNSIKESDKVKGSPNKIDLDAKIREMDERAFKKFQGSILDSLF